MKKYKYKILHTIFIISLIIISISILFIYILVSGYKTILLSASVVLPILLIYTIYLQIKSARLNDIYLDEEKIIITIGKAWVSEEISMLWEDITIISCYSKYIIFKKLYISTRYKSVTLNIRNFKSYKEVLKTIIEKTENNEKIKIEPTVYDLIK